MARLQFEKEDDKVWDQPGGLPINFGARAYTPAAGTSAEDGGKHSTLTDLCSGDWSWKPRHQGKAGFGRWSDGVKITKPMTTFYGVPKGAAELYGPRICN